MPRAQQSKEGSIVTYFTTAPLEIAQVVLRLATDALKARVARSTEARERQLAAQRKAARVTPAPRPAAPRSGPVAAAPKKKSHKKKAAKVAPKSQVEPGGDLYDEGDLT